MATAAGAETHTYSADHFSISIPDGWSAMPANELDRLSQGLRSAAPEADPQIYKYGFAQASGENSPRVLIQVKSERWSEGFLAETSKLPRAKALVQHGVTAANESLAAMQPKIGEMRWDPDAQLLWMRTEVASAQTQVLSGVHLTNEGSVQVHCSGPAAEFEKLAPVCAGIIESVRIDENLRYKARSGVRIFVEDHPAVTAIAAIGIASVIGLGFMGRKKPQDRAIG